MEKSELYQLPKDILVELIASIQHDLKEDCDLYKKILQDLRKMEITVIKCSYKNCKKYMIFKPDVFTNWKRIGHEVFSCCCAESDCEKKCAGNRLKGWCITRRVF